MALYVRELREWLEGRSDLDLIAIEETNLITPDYEDYLEVGGVPEEEEE